MAIRGVLFDVDGTLVNVEERFYHHFNENLKTFGIAPIERGDYEHRRAVGTLSDLIPSEGDARANFWLKFLEDFSHSDHTELGRPFPGALETLDLLKKRGYRMAVITGRTSDPARVLEELALHRLEEYFEFVLTNRNGKNGMNKAENLIKACSMIGFTPSECAYVGDWRGDVESATEAGIGMIIAVLSGGENRESLEDSNPHVILKSIADVPAFLATLKE